MTEAQKKYEKKRMQECKTYAIKYRLYLENENRENERLNKYLKDSGKSANAYIKEIIKVDLDNKGVPYTDSTDNTDTE